MGIYLRDRSPKPQARYDALVVFVGYETRATGLLRSDIRIRRLIALVAQTERSLAFEANLRIVEQQGAECMNAHSIDEIRKAVRAAIGRKATWGQKQSIKRVAVDISSMPRGVIADVIDSIREASAAFERIEVDFLYGPGEYHNPPHEDRARLEIGPLRPWLIGPAPRSRSPLRLAIGLGYESARTRAAIEYLEPTDVWYFVPVSPDERFDLEVHRANADVLGGADPYHALKYDVADPPTTFMAAYSFWAVNRRSRTVLLPLGPKIFAVVCIVLGMQEDTNRPAVWRLGASAERELLDVVESGEYYSLPMVFESR